MPIVTAAGPVAKYSKQALEQAQDAGKPVIVFVTASSPCVLPLLAVTVTTAFQRHRYGPLALAAGLAVSATVLGLVFALVGLALDRDLVRLSAAGLLILVGGVLLSARLQSGLTRLTAPVASTATALASRTAPGGLKGQLVLGALLGAVWSPCAGR